MFTDAQTVTDFQLFFTFGHIADTFLDDFATNVIG